MGDILIVIAVAAVIVALGYGIVAGARRQREAEHALFRRFAERVGLTYQGTDDGTAHEFAREMDGIGRFRSPSLGRLLPEDVVTGAFEGASVVAFRHMSRFSEGDAREWLVAGVVAPVTIAQRVAVQFLKPRGPASTMYLEDPITAEQDMAGFRVIVRSPTPDAAGRLLEDGRLDALAAAASKLPFRPEIQVRGDRLAAYPASRNASLSSDDELEALTRFAIEAATIGSG